MLDWAMRTGRIGTVLGVFYRHRHTSSKTSSFGGTSAQPHGVALFFALMLRSNIRAIRPAIRPNIHQLKPECLPEPGRPGKGGALLYLGRGLHSRSLERQPFTVFTPLNRRDPCLRNLFWPPVPTPLSSQVCLAGRARRGPFNHGFIDCGQGCCAVRCNRLASRGSGGAVHPPASITRNTT